MSDLNYEEDIKIDPDALDVEWLRQSELMLKYTKHAAEMKKEMDDAKERVEMIRASIDNSIRLDPTRYRLEKITEGAIQSKIIEEPHYRAEVEKFSAAKYEYEIAQAAVRAFDQKKTALENLVRLLGVSYFAGPQAPRDLSKEALQQKERQKQNSKVKIQQRRGK